MYCHTCAYVGVAAVAEGVVRAMCVCVCVCVCVCAVGVGVEAQVCAER